MGDRLLAIKEKLKQQKQHIEELEKHMYVPLPRAYKYPELTRRSDEVTAEQSGGEQH